MTTFDGAAPRRFQYHLLQVSEIIDETPTARSIVLDIPPRLQREFRYSAGQFLTVRLRLGPDHYLRCYSMSSSPDTDGRLKITVKRVPGGIVSNFFNDMLKVGYRVETMPPAGDFTLDGSHPGRDLVFLCSGSGITPVISMVKTALATSERRVRLFYANQSRDAIIFADELNDLAARHAGRLEVTHHIYDEAGYVDHGVLQSFIGGAHDIDVYVCGSKRFTAAAADALHRLDVPSDSVHYERFSSDAAGQDTKAPTVEQAAAMVAELGAASLTEKVEIGIRGGHHTLDYRRGDTLLAAARRAQLNPPFSCEGGQCGACMAKILTGEATMIFNRALSAEEVADGWTLTCRAVPMSPTVSVEFPD